jgi:SOS-response transcriptional repressor LexA
VLVQLRDQVDADTGQRFTVKRYRSERTTDAGGWRRVQITLEPTNPEFLPIELAEDDDDSVTVIAELVEVISAERPV